MSYKLFIKNRKGQKICVLVEQAEKPKGLVFVMHGLGGFKEQPQFEAISKVFKDNGYTTIRFDTANTLGESEPGNCEAATYTNYYEDLEDVINWSESQQFFHAPFVLVGASLGGYCVALYAENNPEKVKAVSPVAATISYEININDYDPDELNVWRKTGWQIKDSYSKPGLVKKLNWFNFEADLKNHNLLKKIGLLTMPLLMIIGSNDGSVSQRSQKVFFEAAASKDKELHIIEGAPHTFRDPDHLKQLKEIFDQWIKKI